MTKTEQDKIDQQFRDNARHDDGIGEYYRRKAADAELYRAMLLNPDLTASERRALEYKLELALYTGD